MQEDLLRARLPLLSGPLEALVVANLPVSGPGWKWSHVPRSQEKGAGVKGRKSRLRRTRANQAARIRAREAREAVWGGGGGGGGGGGRGGETPLDCMLYGRI